jgi:hypothetical protein
MGLRNIMALQKKTRGVVRLYQGISEIVADIWRPTVKDGLSLSNIRLIANLQVGSRRYGDAV